MKQEESKMSTEQYHPIHRAIAVLEREEGEQAKAIRPRGSPPSLRDRLFSRRQLFQAAAGASLALGAGGLAPARADGGAEPKPVPETTPVPCGPVHFMFPGPADAGNEPSTIFDFNGFVGGADLKLSGTGTNTATGQKTPYTFHTDWRFMSGVYVGEDGNVHKGTFSFI